MYKNFLIFIVFFTLLLAQEKKKALIFGVTGQDGAYLASFLLKKGYEVYGVKRRASTVENTKRIDHLYYDQHVKNRPSFTLHYGDITDMASVINIIKNIQPDEIYNLAAQSHVLISFELPLYTADVNALGTLRILEAIRILGLTHIKFYQASSSEMFGKVQEIPQKETTPFYPRSPYGVSKIFGFWITKNYREAYGIFASNGILFNHESPLRGENFVTRKIAKAVTKIKYGLQETLYIGNLDAKRDWGHAQDYVEAMWKILQHDRADDWVIATGETHSVRECIEIAFKEIGITIAWQGSNLDEVGYDTKTGKILVRVDARYFRPTEIDILIGDSTKAKTLLNWIPKTHFEELIKEMVIAELNTIKTNISYIT